MHLANLLLYDLSCLINEYEHVLKNQHISFILSSWYLVSVCLNFWTVLMAVVAAGFWKLQFNMETTTY